jgi:hypothetical protein
MADKKRNYDIGYGKPPEEHRWKKGQSGNPKGRPKAAKGLKTILGKELHTRQTIKIAGEPVTASRLQLMVLTLATRAAAGDLKATDRLLPLVIQIFGVDDGADTANRLSAQDQALLDEWLGSVTPEPEERAFLGDEGLPENLDNDEAEGGDDDPEGA